MDTHEQELAGGNVSSVVRVGDFVHRPVNSWSLAVHELLLHLESSGFDGAPRFRGFDSKGREILSFIKGEVGNDPLKPYMWSEAVLIEMAYLLRRYHDSTVDFAKRQSLDNWQIVYPEPHYPEVICHNDVAPYNTVFVGERPVALIDFDTAGPGPRIWDIAYALYRFVPLSRFNPDHEGELVPYDSRLHREERAARIRLFCEAYKFEECDQLPPMVGKRLTALCTLLVERAEAGVPAFQRMVEEGHLDYYREEIEFHKRHYKEYFG